MASVFTVSEEDLFNFDSFCDSKFMDPNCQKYGFFKIKLDAACASQCTSMDGFWAQFDPKIVSKKVTKSLLMGNTKDNNLYGVLSCSASAVEKTGFVSSFRDHSTAVEVTSNCCMRELVENGEEAFLKHFYGAITRDPAKWKQHPEGGMNAALKRASSKRMAFERRQEFKKIVSMEGRKRGIQLAMSLDKITEPASSKCPCSLCLTYVPPGPHEPTSLYCAGLEEDNNNYVHLTANFAMSHLCFLNMLSGLDSVYGGISYPALYLGGLHSAFPLHIEDLSLWSFNYVLHGYPKFWIMIPPTSIVRLTETLHRKGTFDSRNLCRNVLQHKIYIPTVQFLKEANIPYEMARACTLGGGYQMLAIGNVDLRISALMINSSMQVIQHEGDGIVILPNCAHTGGNLGPNLAEACNFGSEKWIPYGCVSMQCACLENSVHTDLTDLVAVHNPPLLQAFCDGKVADVIKDEYFQKSIIMAKEDYIEGNSVMQVRHVTAVPSASLPTVTHSNLPSMDYKSQNTKLRVKCPVCSTSWASVHKANILTHLVKYHKHLMGSQTVRQFIQEYALPFK